MPAASRATTPQEDCAHAGRRGSPRPPTVRPSTRCSQFPSRAPSRTSRTGAQDRKRRPPTERTSRPGRPRPAPRESRRPPDQTRLRRRRRRPRIPTRRRRSSPRAHAAPTFVALRPGSPRATPARRTPRRRAAPPPDRRRPRRTPPGFAPDLNVRPRTRTAAGSADNSAGTHACVFSTKSKANKSGAGDAIHASDATRRSRPRLGHQQCVGRTVPREAGARPEDRRQPTLPFVAAEPEGEAMELAREHPTQ